MSDDHISKIMDKLDALTERVGNLTVTVARLEERLASQDYAQLSERVSLLEKERERRNGLLIGIAALSALMGAAGGKLAVFVQSIL